MENPVQIDLSLLANVVGGANQGEAGPREREPLGKNPNPGAGYLGRAPAPAVGNGGLGRRGDADPR